MAGPNKKNCLNKSLFFTLCISILGVGGLAYGGESIPNCGVNGSDHCADAPDVCPLIQYTGDLVDATNDGTASCISLSGPGVDVWYAYTPAVELNATNAVVTTDSVTVSLCGSNFETILSVHTGCPGTVENEVACSKDNTVCQQGPCLGTELTYEATPGQTYFIRISRGPDEVMQVCKYQMIIYGPPCETNSQNPHSVQDCNENSIPDSCELTRRLLYSIDRDVPVLHIIDPTTAQTLKLIGFFIPDSLRPVRGGKGLAFNPADGLLWALVKDSGQGLLGGGSGPELVTIDPRTGNGSSIGLTSDDFSGLAFGADGTLYGVTGNGAGDPEAIYVINKADATATFLASFTSAQRGEAIAFDPDDGLVYRAGGIRNLTLLPPPPGLFETINPLTLEILPLVDLFVGDRPRGMTYDAIDGSFLLASNGDCACEFAIGFGSGGDSLHRVYPSPANWLVDQWSTICVGQLDHISKGLAFVEVGNDCNANGIPDDCDIDSCEDDPACQDCNQNGIPDGCETDCNANGIPDDCEIALLYSIDRSAPLLHLLSPASGKEIRVIPISLPHFSVYGGTGLALHPQTGELWALLKADPLQDCNPKLANGLPQSSGRELVRINRFTGQATDVGNTGGKFAGLAFDNSVGTNLGDPGGPTLYGVTGDNSDFAAGNSETLFTLDQTNATATEVCFFGRGDNGETIAFDPDNSLLYHASGSSDQIFETFDVNATPTTQPVVGDGTCVTTDIPLTGDFSEATALTYWQSQSLFLITGFDRLFRLTPNGVLSSVGNISHSSKGLVVIDGSANDCDGNGVPDDCEPDCNNNGIPDTCEIADCDGSPGCGDCNENGIPDECEPDCNGNGIPDDCDIANGTSGNCLGLGIPDECIAGLLLSACPDDITVEATDATGIVVNYPTPSATGGCNPTVTVDPPSGSLLPIGTTQVTVTASDQLGSVVTCQFNVTVTAPQPGGQTAPQQALPCDNTGLNVLFSLLFRSPVCGLGCLPMLILTFIGIVSMRIKRRRRRP